RIPLKEPTEKSANAAKRKPLRQHRTILRVEARRPVFWQVKQKCSRILCVFASIFVTVAGKSASEATLKASAVNCAVLPYTEWNA
ncbi:hypothetical protein, partial [Ruthenibacterium lactatiformans]